MKDLSKGDKVQEFWSEYECVGEENEGGKRGGGGCMNLEGEGWKDLVPCEPSWKN